MLSWMKSRRVAIASAKHLYGAVVAAARRPELFRAVNAADTPLGRFEVLALHMVLVLERLEADGAATEAARRRLVEAFVEDMDDSMREMGIGDLAVPKKVKKAAGALYDRVATLRPLLATGAEPELAEALARDVPAAPGATIDAGRFARYVLSADRALAGQPTESILGGQLPFARVAV
ncbi:MAG: ubiquinol-cytochrome C chaperone family protein [Hyphomicrobium sp.]|nr:ubiquinol-cytochrome C chaperone family protein [Hyphomicrobium sp.]